MDINFIQNWSISDCKDFLKSHQALQTKKNRNVEKQTQAIAKTDVRRLATHCVTHY